ncbi:MAG: hypothetical protein Q7S43_03430 [bacterium]|nr:hypothetical protein [bacterium]
MFVFIRKYHKYLEFVMKRLKGFEMSGATRELDKNKKTDSFKSVEVILPLGPPFILQIK